MNKSILMALAILCIVVVTPVHAKESFPFGPGEQMRYEIHWTMFFAGYAQLKVKADTDMNGVPARYFWAKAKTAPWVDNFYKVRDVLEAWTNMDVTHSLRYKKDQNEGSYHKKVDLLFDTDNNQTKRWARGKLQHVIDQPDEVFDPMSILFAFRKQPLYVGMKFKSNVTDGKVSVVSEAVVEKKENVDTGIGDIEAYRVRLDIKHLSGVFKKSDDAELLVWFSADERRIPVKVRSKVAVGHFTMKLIEYKPPRT
ncbi:DUF3108 domain-containing protein [Pseudodesulfovibrio sediminis]|uniref:DUF3108 domain-containing protein n=1 Tax=Pseudodesulfovibrio sediminis TaxID=2810563 RepID=A0ABN6ETB9_9BACT|nr:DUF3108 domain-containing protein [Pseudodesulfovibrio sediminis]BCS88341.1 hypothetical protein PSDVSF_15830 [Pseudodesulfovibrio sediminis]